MMKYFVFLSLSLFLLASCDSKVTTANEISGLKTFKYEDQPMQPHYIIALIDRTEIDNYKDEFSQFNSTKGGKKRLSNIFLGSDLNSPLMIIRKFDNFKLASDYSMQLNKKIRAKKSIPISQQNYRSLLRNKSFETYKSYYIQKLR